MTMMVMMIIMNKYEKHEGDTKWKNKGNKNVLFPLSIICQLGNPAHALYYSVFIVNDNISICLMFSGFLRRLIFSHLFLF